MTPLRYLAAINPSTPRFDRLADDALVTFVPLEAVWAGGLDVSRRRPKAAVSAGYTRFLEGDIVMPKITPTFQADRAAIAKGLEGRVAAGTTELHVVRTGPQAESRYLRYLLSSRPFLQGGEAEMIGVAGQKRVPDDWLRTFDVPVLDVATQRTIADFLDAETARIDALVRKKQRLQALLTERWRAQVDRVTHCGREVSVRSVTSLITSGPRGWAERAGESGEPFIRSANLQRTSLDLRTENLARVDRVSSSEAQRSRVREEDSVIGITGANTGWVGYVTASHSPGYVSQHVAILRPSEIEPAWLAYSLFAQRTQEQLLAGQYGGTKQQLGLDDLAELMVYLPSTSEQRVLCATLDRAGTKTAALDAAFDAQVLLLQERRQALITAAVTGELDIAGAA